MWSASKLLFLVLGSLLLAQGYEGYLSEQSSKTANDFSIDILKTVFNRPNRNDNTVVSPVSLYCVLALLQQGTGGSSLAELTTVLHANSTASREAYYNLTRSLKGEHNSAEVQFANKLFVKNGFEILPEFKNVAVQDFLSDIEAVDFLHANEAAQAINSWVSQNTNQRIPKLVKPDMITANTVLMLLNAVFFSGEWRNQFYPQATENNEFHTLGGAISRVPTMHFTKDVTAGHNPDIGAKFVTLPFRGNEFSMMLIVPDEIDGLSNVITRLQSEQLTSLMRHDERRRVQLSLPKFKFETTSDFVEILKQLGVSDIFETTADLSGIASGRLVVSHVLQKAEIEVDEKGAKASAATSVGINAKSGRVFPNKELLEINADHPFLFFITDDKNKVPLFCGWVGVL
ncbi:leukocyte elastase inhibitor-like isoform X2 [Periplaneta americana]|uniref:leukocyte elastase inhibitor-like isoform X2 n=1 Tax=Periplaneta americana TaxID=6978 RepID=UPI0037E742E3